MTEEYKIKIYCTKFLFMNKAKKLEFNIFTGG